MKIIGIQRNVSFTYNGVPYSGTNIYTSEESPKVEGVLSQKFFFNKDKDAFQDTVNLKVGDSVRIGFNQYGKPNSISKI